MQVNHSARPQGIAPTTPRSGSHYRFTTVKRQTCIVGATLAVALSTLRWASNSAALGDSTHYMTNSLAAPFVHHEGITRISSASRPGDTRRNPIMTFDKIVWPSVGADLSRPAPIYRPSLDFPLSR